MVFWGTSLPPLVVTWFVYDPYFKSRVIWKKANIDIWESQIEIVYYWSHWNKGSTFGLNWQTNDTRRPNYYFFQQRPFILNKEFLFLKNILSLQTILNTDYIQRLKVEIRNNITLFFVMRPWLTTHEPWMTGCQQQNKKWSIELTINFQFVFLNKTIMVSFIWRPIFE